MRVFSIYYMVVEVVLLLYFINILIETRLINEASVKKIGLS